MPKIKVLYIAIDSYMGGSTASLLNLIDSVKDEVYPIVLFPEEGIGQACFMERGIECYVYPFIKLCSFQKNRLIDVWNHPWRWHYIKKWRYDRGCVRFVKKVLNGRKVDVVHSNTSPNDIGVLLARNLQAKHVWHVREFCDLDFNFDIYRGLSHLRNLINSAGGRIAISSAIKTHWQMPDKNSWVINDAIRSKNEACCDQTKEKYLLFSAYFMTEPKGTRMAITAFAKSGMAKEGFRLKLMGNCEEGYKKSLLETIRGYGIVDAIDFVPCQTDVKPWFSKATAYIMASECEGLGRVTAEAMFYGCPVVAHATGGTLDLVKDGVTGYLYNTVEKCSQLIQKVCVEDQTEIVLRAQKFAVENLSEEVYGPKIMEVYNSVMK